MIALIDYGAGNLTSVRLAFDAIGADCRITADPRDILAADRVVFPGVGAAGSAMRSLRKLGLVEALPKVAAAGTPFLGICLGAQIIFTSSEEDGGIECLGLVRGTVRKFSPSSRRDKVPHMGWNAVALSRRGSAHPVFRGIDDDSEFYFVHGYYPVPDDQSCVLGETDYAGVQFASVTGKGNLVATQFHPEKSGRIGLKLLSNFANWDGTTG